MGPRNPIQRLANRSKPAVDQQRVTLEDFLLESSKWMVLMITNNGASIHHGRDQSLIVIRNLMKLCKSPNKTFCMLLRTVNGSYIMKYQVNFVNTTSSLKGSCMEKKHASQLKFFVSSGTRNILNKLLQTMAF